MEVLLSVLCSLAFLVLVVTLVGHGLWLMFAAIFRGLSAESRRAQPPSARPCPTCGQLAAVVDGRCQVCGAVPAISPPVTLTRELEATARHLERLLRRGIVRPDEYERLMDSIRADLARLKGGIAQGAAPAARSAQLSAPVRNANEAVVDATLVEPASTPAPIGAPQAVPQQGATVTASPFAPPSPLAPVRTPGVVHPLDRTERIPSSAPPPPSVPTRTLSEMFRGFMEESNIRAGEVVAGALIVFCAVGLVVSLRSTLKAIPYAPALLFMLFTVAFHGAGLYSLRRWNLHAVSRVVLIIALLLVPLGFSAGIVLSDTGPSPRPITDVYFLAALATGVLAFGWVTVSAARVTVGSSWWLLSIAVMGSSLGQVIANRMTVAGMSVAKTSLVACMPLMCFLAAASGQLLTAGLRTRLNRNRAAELFLVLGIASFSLVVPLALMVHLSGERLAMLANLSPTISLAAAAVAAAGLAVHLRVRAKSLAIYRFAGTAVAALGGIAMLAAVALAWPRPDLLLTVAIANCVVSFALAMVSRVAPLYGAALLSGTLACVIGVHLLGGTLPAGAVNSTVLLHALLTCRSGLVLTALAAIAGVGGWQLLRRGKVDEGAVFVACAAGFSALGALLAAFVGYVPQRVWQVEPASDLLLAAPLLIFHGLTILTFAPRFRQASAAVAGSALLWLGLVNGLAWNESVRHALEAVQLLPLRPVLCATLIHSVIAGLLSLAAAGPNLLANAGAFAALPRFPRWKHLIQPLSLTAAAALAGALPFVVWAHAAQLYWHASYALWGAVVCTALLLIWRHAAAMASLQAMLALAAAFLTAAIARDWIDLPSWRFDWRHLNAQLAVMALAAAVWSGIRSLSARWPVVREIAAGHEITVDQGLLALAAVATPLLAIVGVLPGIFAELDASFALADWPLEQWTASAGGIGDWAPVAAVALALTAMAAAEGRVREAFSGFVAVLFAAPWIVAGWFDASVAVASTARWGLAMYVAIFAGGSLAAGKLLTPRMDLLGRAATVAARPSFAIWPFALGTAAILWITLAVVSQSLAGHAFGGPAPGSWFGKMGPTLSFGIPLSVLVIVSLAFSLAWRRAEMSILASALFQLTANLAFLIHLSSSTAATVPVRWVEWLQWNALALGLFGVIWSAVEAWKKRLDAGGALRGDDLQMERWGNLAQLFICGLAVRALAAWAAGAVFWLPNQRLFVTPQLGGWESYAALAFAAAFLLWRSQRRLHYLALGVVALAVMLVAFIAASVDGYDATRQWLSYHVLTAGLLAVGVIAGVWHAAGRGEILAARSPSRSLSWPVPDHWGAGAIAGAVAVMALRGTTFDPVAPWWSAGAAAGAVAIVTMLGIACRSQGYAYASTLLAGLPTAIFLIDAPRWAVPWRATFGEACLLGPLALAALWLWREIRSQRRNEQSFDAGFVAPAVHRFAAAAGLGAMALLVALRLFLGIIGEMDHLPLATQVRIDASQGVALLVLLVLIGFSLWDRRALGTIPFLYFGGLLVAGFGLHLLRWPIFTQVMAQKIPPFSYVELLYGAFPLAMGLYVALTGELWHRGARLGLWGQRLGISDPVGGLERTVVWLPGASVLLTIAACAGGAFAVMTLNSLALRVAAGFAPFALAWGIARQAQQARELPLQIAALALAGLSAVLLGWAEMPPEFTEQAWMTRMFRLLMALSALTFLYGLALPRFLFVEGAWNRSYRIGGYGSAVLAMATFIAVLALEFVWFVPGQGAPVADVQVAAVAIVLLALVAGLISLALFPQRDPLFDSEFGRTGYVYAAEAVLSLLFAHLYLCKPYWFGLLRPYWPYVVMAIAYAGVGAGEIFSRLRLRVLAEPLRNTGALMPLLPALAMWVVAPQESDYALVLFLAGVMYVALSIAQGSWLFAAAAGVAGNGALWTILRRSEFDFTQNPQFWLIPPAVSVLVAAHVNRNRLDPKVLTAVRYAATIAIYLSSTSEVFLRGIGSTVWPPIALLSLSLAGVLAGVMFRVRAFLYLGVGFTMMALVTMVWHAARAIDQTWPWWAFGIGAGIALLTVFALFEKKREELRSVMDSLRQWEQ